MKIAIIGYGFVGKALKNAMQDNIEVKIIDPKLETKISELDNFNPKIIFICVPTPMNKDASQDISIVLNVLDDIKKINLKSLLVIKSTVHPGFLTQIEKTFPNIIYNPEFLREEFADMDFINSNLIVFGGKKNLSNKLSTFYKDHTKCKCKDHVFTDVISASLIKYTINSFLATKVIFFNQIYDLFKTHNSSDTWDEFIEAVSKDNRIGKSHMQVPGPDGRYGFGGACFPKDTSAILKYAESVNCDLNLIKSVIQINNKIRTSYDMLTDRENEQYIKYNFEEE